MIAKGSQLFKIGRISWRFHQQRSCLRSMIEYISIRLTKSLTVDCG